MLNMRKQIIAGNWKMNGLLEDSKIRLEELIQLTNGVVNADILICPPFTILSTINNILKVSKSNIKLGAQDCHFNEKGAHTGDISPNMLKDLGVSYVILGHSERRANHKEDNALIQKKASAVINTDMIAILCVGETKEQKENGQTINVVLNQLTEGLPKTFTSENTIIAYEPVWAIGTGLTPTIEEIEATHYEIRKIVEKLSNKETANKIKILYGGSLSAKNADQILPLENIDGGLVGGASLISTDFHTIIINTKNFN
jgi:triosephosphate isomerase